MAGCIESTVSPNTARWQQQINSSFEALVSGALLSPRLADSHQLADCSDWRYAVDDVRGVCPTVDNLRRKDWSLRHLEQRSDSRDSGLESDAAGDRHCFCPVKKPHVARCLEDQHSSRAAFSLRSSEPFTARLLEMDDGTRCHSPLQLHSSLDADNYRVYGVPGKKELHTALAVQQHDSVNELTNGFSSYPHTQDRSGPTVFQHHSSVSSLHDISRLHSSQSKCLSRSPIIAGQ